MPLWLAIPCGVGPCLIWLWLIYRRDDHEPEPRLLVLSAVLLGALATIGVWWTAPWLARWIGSDAAWVGAFVVTAPIEEGWKLLALLPLLLHMELDEPLDGVIYGAAVGLGFAGVENVVNSQNGGDATLLVQRAFTATLVHASCTGCLGFCWAVGRLHRFGRGRVFWAIIGLAIAVAIHGAYNYFLADSSRRGMLVSLLVVLPTGLVLLVLKVRWARARSPRYHRSE